MTQLPAPAKDEERLGKQLYDYQQDAIDDLFHRIIDHPSDYGILYQLPTGGGKTVIFSEITRKYVAATGKKVIILTHRIELCHQTSALLSEFGVDNLIINSQLKALPVDQHHQCYVAMVETLNNRLNAGVMEFKEPGLVIIDEAHYNSFRKLFRYFQHGTILGVTATPLSSNIKLPMKQHYNELIVGESIANLIAKGFLAQAHTFTYQVGLTGLKIGINGDYTVSSSERLYSNAMMQQKLLMAYEERCKGKKTLIFNNGIQTSMYVMATFKEAGYAVKHLDNTHTAAERREILDWFRDTPDAILTSVSILTTGFDEPTVDCIVLNRATRSLTLYFQMIGRGSRILGNKKSFTVIDLGNNLHRFGLWENPIDWKTIFATPELHLANLKNDEQIEREFTYVLPSDLQMKFNGSPLLSFDVKEAHKLAIMQGQKPKLALDLSLQNHLELCQTNSTEVEEALELAALLDHQIEYRVKQYAQCISKSSDNYVQWLIDDYKRKLRMSILGFNGVNSGSSTDPISQEAN